MTNIYIMSVAFIMNCSMVIMTPCNTFVTDTDTEFTDIQFYKIQLDHFQFYKIQFDHIQF